jgi:L-asparaginase
MSKPKVAFVTTGGTIGSKGKDSLDIFDYAANGERYGPEDLLALFPEAAAVADVTPVDFGRLSSSAVDPKTWLALKAKVEAVAADHDGVVVTHGTASLEETAYFLHLTLKTPKTVVVIGSQRPSSGFATDAGMNLLNGLQTAGAPEARGMGVLTLLNNEIQCAREVTKTSTYRLQTFHAPDMGMLGHADADGRIAIYRKPARRHAPDTEFDVAGMDDLPRVDIVYSYAGAPGDHVTASIAAGAEAIVVATMAPGTPAPAQKQALQEANEKGIPVIFSCRAGSGRVLDRSEYFEQGWVSADNLNPQKARILTMLGLTVSKQPDELRRMFAEY